MKGQKQQNNIMSNVIRLAGLTIVKSKIVGLALDRDKSELVVLSESREFRAPCENNTDMEFLFNRVSRELEE